MPFLLFLKYFKYFCSLFFSEVLNHLRLFVKCSYPFYVDLFESWSIPPFPFRISFIAFKIHQISPTNKFQFSKQRDLNHSTQISEWSKMIYKW